MEFIIKEIKNGYLYKGTNYIWGNGLTELVNNDFSDFNKCVETIKNNAMQNYDSSDEIEIAKFFSPLIKLKTSSVHINLFQDYLKSFFDIYDIADEVGNIKMHSIDSLLTCLNYDFAARLKVTKNNYKKIFEKCKTKHQYLLKEFLDKETIKRVNENYYTKEILYPTPNAIKILKINNNGKFYFERKFYKLEDFCRYEFFKMLENETKISKCPYCQKYFIPETGSDIYCSSECRKKANDGKLKESPYYKKYRAAYLKIYNHKNTDYRLKDRKDNYVEVIFSKLKQLYNDYKGKPVDNLTLQEYVKKINNILPNFLSIN